MVFQVQFLEGVPSDWYPSLELLLENKLQHNPTLAAYREDLLFRVARYYGGSVIHGVQYSGKRLVKISATTGDAKSVPVVFLAGYDGEVWQVDMLRFTEQGRRPMRRRPGQR